MEEVSIMDNVTIIKAVSGMIITAMLFVCPQASFADDGAVYCAAVLPCDEQGRVLPEYDEGKCGEVYAAQCAQSQVNDLNEKLFSCYDSADKKERRLKRKLRRLKQALRVAKNK